MTPLLHPAMSHAYPVITLCFVIIMVCGGGMNPTGTICNRVVNVRELSGTIKKGEITSCTMELGAELFRKCVLCCCVIYA